MSCLNGRPFSPAVIVFLLLSRFLFMRAVWQHAVQNARHFVIVPWTVLALHTPPHR